MRVADQLGGGEVPLRREGELGKELGKLRPDEVPADQLAPRG